MHPRTLLIVAALWLPVAGTGTAADDGPDHGILWRVETDEAAPSHILGTIHSNDPRVLDLSAPVERAFADADRYVFEVDLERVADGEGMNLMFDMDGRPLADKLPDDLWQRARTAARERGIPEPNLQALKAWALALVLVMPDADPTTILDYRLHERARKREEPVTSLESVEEQIGIFDGLEQDRQIGLLRQALDYIEEQDSKARFDELVELYLDRDLAGMARLAESHPLLPGADDNASLMRKLLDQRSRIMVTRMQSALNQGGAFIAIGALHLPGENGILRRLREQGYSVTAVY